jgi:hypothetical protein
MPEHPILSCRSPHQLFDDSLYLHDQCVGAGLVEASYHALAAAMLCAEAASSRKAIELVIELAHQRQRAIDAERPPHLLSSREARTRGITPLFKGLAVTAEGIRVRTKPSGRRSGASKLADKPPEVVVPLATR